MKLYRLGDNLCKLIAGKNLFIFNADGKEEKFLDLIVVVGYMYISILTLGRRAEILLFRIDEKHSLQ